MSLLLLLKTPADAEPTTGQSPRPARHGWGYRLTHAWKLGVLLLSSLVR